MKRWLSVIMLALAACGGSSESKNNGGGTGGTGGALSQDAGNDHSSTGSGGAGNQPEDAAIETGADTPAPADRPALSDAADASDAPRDALTDRAPPGPDARPDGIPVPPNGAPPCDPALKVVNGAPCHSQGTVISCQLPSEAGPPLVCFCASILNNRWTCAPDSGVGIGPAGAH